MCISKHLCCRPHLNIYILNTSGSLKTLFFRLPKHINDTNCVGAFWLAFLLHQFRPTKHRISNHCIVPPNKQLLIVLIVIIWDSLWMIFIELFNIYHFFLLFLSFFTHFSLHTCFSSHNNRIIPTIQYEQRFMILYIPLHTQQPPYYPPTLYLTHLKWKWPHAQQFCPPPNPDMIFSPHISGIFKRFTPKLRWEVPLTPRSSFIFIPHLVKIGKKKTARNFWVLRTQEFSTSTSKCFQTSNFFSPFAFSQQINRTAPQNAFLGRPALCSNLDAMRRPAPPSYPPSTTTTTPPPVLIARPTIKSHQTNTTTLGSRAISRTPCTHFNTLFICVNLQKKLTKNIHRTPPLIHNSLPQNTTPTTFSYDTDYFMILRGV